MSSVAREMDVFFREREAEENVIIARAKADGSYVKAPNGEPTKLTASQWVRVRTKGFKDWFGDWEKPVRIGKLRKSKPVEITGKEIEPSEDLKQYRKNALEGATVAEAGEPVDSECPDELQPRVHRLESKP